MVPLGSGNHHMCDHLFNGSLYGWTQPPTRTEIVSGFSLLQPYNVQSTLVDFGSLYKVDGAFLNSTNVYQLEKYSNVTEKAKHSLSNP